MQRTFPFSKFRILNIMIVGKIKNYFYCFPEKLMVNLP